MTARHIPDLEEMTPVQLLALDQRRYVEDPTGELHRAQQQADTLQRFTLFGFAGVIILVVLICF